jgi:hypothetical protein
VHHCNTQYKAACALFAACTHGVPRRPSCRRLSWQSDDLAALGPVVAAFGAFTGLRLLSLSCTPDTLRRACGNTDRTGLQHAATTIGVARDESLLRELLPYADLELQRC